VVLLLEIGPALNCTLYAAAQQSVAIITLVFICRPPSEDRATVCFDAAASRWAELEFFLKSVVRPSASDAVLLDRSGRWPMADLVVTPSATIDLNVEPPFRLGSVSFDPLSREATFDGGTERLQPQNFKVLVALAQRRGQVVTRDELIDLCWGGRFLGDDVVSRAISTLRQLAAKVGGFEIETVSRTGYRLTEATSDRARPRRSFLVIGATAGFLIVLMAFGIVRSISHPASDLPMPTIEILPLGGNAMDPRVRELSIATRNSLARTLVESGFPVRLVETGSAEPQATDLELVGDVRRDDATRINIRIVRRAKQLLVYSQDFKATGPDVDSLPESVGAQVAAALSWTGPLMVLDDGHASNPGDIAQELRQLAIVVSGGDPLEAYKIAREVAPREPKSTIAQLSLAIDTRLVLDELPASDRPEALMVARRAGDDAKALSPNLGDVYVSWCHLHSPVRLAECESHLRQGLRADPNGQYGAYSLSVHLSYVGRLGEALQFAKLALANDRYKMWKIAVALRALETEGRSFEAEQLFRQADRWWPRNPIFYQMRWWGMLARGDFGAIEALEKTYPPGLFAPDDHEPATLMAAVRTGDEKRASSFCRQPAAAASPMTCFVVLQRLGDLDDAFALAHRLYPNMRGRTPAEEDRLWLSHVDTLPLDLLSAPSTAPFRRDARFLAVAARVGLLDYWRTVHLPDFCQIEHEPVCKAIARSRA
jgi:DNA-binding winged helix-turn-helix (wHTH) protein